MTILLEYKERTARSVLNTWTEELRADHKYCEMLFHRKKFDEVEEELAEIKEIEKDVKKLANYINNNDFEQAYLFCKQNCIGDFW